MLKANILNFTKEKTENKNESILIFDIDTARVIYSFATHLIINLLSTLKENQEIYINKNLIKNQEDFQKACTYLFQEQE